MRQPNIQNIPIRTTEGKAIRDAFTPTWPNIDYSDIEERAMGKVVARSFMVYRSGGQACISYSKKFKGGAMFGRTFFQETLGQ